MPWWRTHSPNARYIDMWMFPGMHPTNVDLLQRLKSADDRQFTTNMDVVGTVSEYDADKRGWIESYQVGLRTDIWTPDQQEQQDTVRKLQQLRKQELREEIKSSGRLNSTESALLEHRLQDDAVMSLKPGDVETRRLVLKHFRSTGTRIRWVGSLEELTSWELANSLAAKNPLLSLSVNLSEIDLFTVIQQHHQRFRYPATYGFCFLDESTRRVLNITIKRKWVSVGADFTIEADGKRVGVIDGNLIGFGYNAYLDVHEPQLAQNRRLMEVLSLFVTSVGYHKALWKGLRKRLQSIRLGNWQLSQIDSNELQLLQAPRRRSA